MDDDQTRIVTLASGPDNRMDERVHCLEAFDSRGAVRRHLVGTQGATIGRSAPSEIVLDDSEASRAHCRLTFAGDVLVVADLSSTNGTFIDGTRLDAPTPLPVGAVLRVGHTLLKHEWRTSLEVLQSDQLDRELAQATAYVEALLPAPIAEGSIRAEWVYQPSAKLGGDAFGYGALSQGQFTAYLIDVSGHGAGAAMHSVSAMNVLREHALPGVDMANPAQVLAALNDMFLMERHADLYFTMWYGVFDRASRRLDFASAGHHPAYVRPADRDEAIALRTKNGLIGAVPGKTFVADSSVVPPGASLFLFSDGVFEIVTSDGVQWSLQDFLPLILRPPVDGLSTCQRIFRDVASVARPGGFDDDFSLVQLTFD